MDQDSDTGSRRIITLELDGDTPLDYMVLSIFWVDDTQYIALLPADSDGDFDEDVEVCVYRYHLLEDEDFLVESIDDEDEYDHVIDYLDDLLNAEEFDELFEDIQEE